MSNIPKPVYVMSEPHLSGYRVILGYNTLGDASQAHDAAVNALPELLERVKRYEAALKKIDAGHLPDLEGKPDVLDYAIATRVFYMKLARAALNQEGGQ